MAFNLIPNAPNGLNNLLTVSSFFNLIPQVTDVDHDRLGRNNTLLLPDPFENIIGRKDPVRVAR